MPSTLAEHQIFTDLDGKPLVNGSVYYGVQNQDPVLNPITVYSDRGLTTTLDNPQPLDAYGKTLNKVWVAGKYSIRVDDSTGSQVYQELDAGDTTETGITNLTNVAGTDTITAEGSPVVLALTDNQQYNFRAAAANTGAVTLQIDLTAAKSIKKQHDVDLVSGDIEANQTVSVIYNATDDTFELVSNVALGAADLTLTGDFTYQGVIQPAIPAQATNHIRAGNTQILDGETTVSTITVSSLTAASTWETFGPTGSGATNILTDMDSVPSTATIGIFKAVVGVTTSGTGQGEMSLYATNGDDATPAQNSATTRARIVRDEDAAITGQNENSSTVYIPLNSSQVFKATWAVAGGSGIAYLYYQGFITD